MKFVLALAALLATVVVAAPISNAATTASGCTYKMSGVSVYLKINGTGGMCDLVGQSAGGSAVRVYDGVRGSLYCILADRQISRLLTSIYSTNPTAGRFFCNSLRKTGHYR
jgi:hypothetical protein